MLKRTVLAKSLLVAFSGTTALYGVSALAQSTAPSTQVASPANAASGASPSTPATGSATGGDQLQSVVVTGSMIRRTNAETAEAVTIISAKALRDMGITTTEQAVAQISANQSGITTGSSVSTYTGGGSFADLRGIGKDKTLVLLDGQRLANNVVYGSGVDLNGIPFAAIDHIEVLREGASSVYGADAIAGVINFITKKNYEGGEINITGTKPQDAGGTSGAADITYGKGDLEVDGYNFLISANISRQNELTAAQRSFSHPGYDPARGLTGNLNGQGGPWPGGYTDANGNVFQTGYPACAGNPHLANNTGYCAYLYTGAVDLIPPATQASGLLSFTKKLDAENTLGIQYYYSRSQVTPWGGPATYSFAMNPSSPYFPTAANSTPMPGYAGATPDLADPITAGWTDPNNNRYMKDVNTEQRLLLTLSGEHGGWDYGGAFGYSANRNKFDVTGGYANLSVLAPGGVLSNSINPFGAQSAAGQALINSSYLNGALASGSLTLLDINGHASHKIGDYLWAGREATLGLGASFRNETMGYDPTALATTLYPITYYPPSSIHGSRDSEAIYAELNLPVTKQFEITLSDREDRYSDFGETNNGKASFRYQPVEMVTFRGAASTGFRAPSLVDLYSPNTFGAAAGAMQGPGCTATPPVYTAVFTQSNCTAQGMALYGGNSNLQPEKSKNFDLGVVLEPVKDLGVTIDWFKVVVTNEIQAIPAAAIYSDPNAFGGYYKLNSAGSLTQSASASLACANGPASPTCGYINLTTTNTGGISTSGVDLSVNYRLRTTGYGLFRFGMEGTYVGTYLIQEYKGAPWISTRGKFNAGNQPSIEWQHLLTVDWTKGNWGAGISEHYTSAYGDEFPDANGNTMTVKAYSLWNGYGSYKATSSVTILAGINNIFNTAPGFSNQTANWQSGYNPVFSSALGRAFYAKVTYEF